jgi:hypothetical protein
MFKAPPPDLLELLNEVDEPTPTEAISGIAGIEPGIKAAKVNNFLRDNSGSGSKNKPKL